MISQREKSMPYLGPGVGLIPHLSYQNFEGGFGGGGHYSVAQQPQFIGSIITGEVQLGMVHPIGTPIRVSTHRGFSFPVFLSNLDF